MNKLSVLAIILTLIATIISCSHKPNNDASANGDADSIGIADDDDYIYGLPRYFNHVAGHDEKDFIVGNFTGQGIDTIRIEYHDVEGEEDELGFGFKYMAVSDNPNIPEIELFGCPLDAPMLVYEGDVEGDGRDEWGYLHTWLTSQWRYYRIFNYNPQNKKWRFLFYDTDDTSFLSTSEFFRSTGLDIVEKGPKARLIKINYMTDGVYAEIRDTIIAPTYTPISKEHW